VPLGIEEPLIMMMISFQTVYESGLGFKKETLVVTSPERMIINAFLVVLLVLLLILAPKHSCSFSNLEFKVRSSSR